MKKTCLFYCFFVVITSSFFCAVKEIKGVYKGENLVLRSALNNETNSFCITDVYLNGEKLELDLSHMTLEIPFEKYLNKGDQISLRVYYTPNCEPEVVNEGVIKRKTLFAFLSFSASNDGLRWTTRGETNDSYYLVQRLEEGRWVTAINQPSKARMSGNVYDLEFDHYSGFSVYRVKYVQKDGFKDVSTKVKFRSVTIPVSFFPTKVKDVITFVNNKKKPVVYKVYDIKGNLELQGEGLTIDCRSLEGKNMYTLVFDNQHKPFQKTK